MIRPSTQTCRGPPHGRRDDVGRRTDRVTLRRLASDDPRRHWRAKIELPPAHRERRHEQPPPTGIGLPRLEQLRRSSRNVPAVAIVADRQRLARATRKPAPIRSFCRPAGLPPMPAAYVSGASATALLTIADPRASACEAPYTATGSIPRSRCSILARRARSLAMASSELQTCSSCLWAHRPRACPHAVGRGRNDPAHGVAVTDGPSWTNVRTSRPSILEAVSM